MSHKFVSSPALQASGQRITSPGTNSTLIAGSPSLYAVVQSSPYYSSDHVVAASPKIGIEPTTPLFSNASDDQNNLDALTDFALNAAVGASKRKLETDFPDANEESRRAEKIPRIQDLDIHTWARRTSFLDSPRESSQERKCNNVAC